MLSELKIQQLSATRAVYGFGCWGLSRKKLLDKQSVFFHTVIQAHKTIQTGVPRGLYESLSSNYPYRTRSAASGQIRQDTNFTVQASFKFRAMQYYNQVPASVRKGATATVKKKLKSWFKSNIPLD